MTTENRVLMAQLLGLAAIVAARFGIEISPEAQADILAGLSAFGLLLTAVIAKTKAPAKPGASLPPNDQAGRAQPWMLSALALLALLLAVLALSGCGALQAPTANNTLTAASKGLEELTRDIGAAQKGGRITVEREAVLLDRVQHANDDLRRAQQLLASCQPEACAAPADLLQRLNDEVARIRSELPPLEQQP